MRYSALFFFFANARTFDQHCYRYALPAPLHEGSEGYEFVRISKESRTKQQMASIFSFLKFHKIVESKGNDVTMEKMLIII